LDNDGRFKDYIRFDRCSNHAVFFLISKARLTVSVSLFSQKDYSTIKTHPLYETSILGKGDLDKANKDTIIQRRLKYSEDMSFYGTEQ